MRETRRTRVSLVLRVEDFATGQVLTGKDATVSAEGGYVLPVYKNDGYFVFTGETPKEISVSAKGYVTALFSPDDSGGVYRMALLPDISTGAVYELPVPDKSEVFAGFGGKKPGYPLSAALPAGALEISLQMTLPRDLTHMRHVLLGADISDAETVTITEGSGGGKYRLASPATKPRAARECRLIPLQRVIGGSSGKLRLPVPSGAEYLWVSDSDGLRRIEITV